MTISPNPQGNGACIIEALLVLSPLSAVVIPLVFLFFLALFRFRRPEPQPVGKSRKFSTASASTSENGNFSDRQDGSSSSAESCIGGSESCDSCESCDEIYLGSSKSRDGTKAARPQHVQTSLGYEEVWPERWGMTLEQVKTFIAECREEEGWSNSLSMYDLVEQFVKPRTASTGAGLALALNKEEPKEVTVMVSHAWSERVVEFVKALELSARKGDVFFVCAFSIYQNEDRCGPTIAEQLGEAANESPFRRVLEHILQRGKRSWHLWRWQATWYMLPSVMVLMSLTWLFLPMVTEGCVPVLVDGEGIVCFRSASASSTDQDEDSLMQMGGLKGKWVHNKAGHSELLVSQQTPMIYAAICAGAALLLLLLIKHCMPYWGRMLVVPNRQCDLYTRLWCVYEIFTAQSLGVPIEFAHSLAKAGNSKSDEALCGSPEDQRRIRGEIEECGLRSSRLLLGHREVSRRQAGFQLVDKVIAKTKLQVRNRILKQILFKAWPSLLSITGLARVLLEVEPNSRVWWLAQVLVDFILGDLVAASVMFLIVKHRQGRIRHRDILCMECFFVCLATSCWVAVKHLNESGLMSLSWVWVVLLAGHYTRKSFSLPVVVLLKALCRVPCCEYYSQYTLKAMPAVHFLLIPFCLFSIITFHGCATVAFYVMVAVSVFICTPLALVEVALDWDVRLEGRHEDDA